MGSFATTRLDAPNALATTTDPLPQQPVRLQLGGPLAKDRMFGFANVERTQQDKTGFVTIAPANVAAVNAALDAFGYRRAAVATGGFPTGYDTTNVFGRVDQVDAAGTRLEARYSLYDVAQRRTRATSAG